MSADFSVTVDTARRLIAVRMAGFFTLDDVRRYHDAITTAGAQLGGEPTTQVVLGDIREMRIQSQDVVDAFTQVMADPRNRGRRVALVVTASLARMQANRATHVAGRETRTFFDVTEAEAWLMGAEQADFDRSQAG